VGPYSDKKTYQALGRFGWLLLALPPQAVHNRES
jgi:hypothetical protein